MLVSLRTGNCSWEKGHAAVGPIGPANGDGALERSREDQGSRLRQWPWQNKPGVKETPGSQTVASKCPFPLEEPGSLVEMADSKLRSGIDVPTHIASAHQRARKLLRPSALLKSRPSHRPQVRP